MGAVAGDRHNGRFDRLVVEDGRQGPYDDARGAQRDDRPAGNIKHPQMLGDGGEGDVDIALQPSRQPVDLGPRQFRPQPPRRRQTGLAEDHDRRQVRHRQARPRRCTRIIEKYGTRAGSTASSGAMTCSAKVACWM